MRCVMRMSWLAPLLLSSFQQPVRAQELELRVEPARTLYVNQTARLYGTHDVMVQTISVINRSGGPIQFEELVLSAGDSTITILSERIIPEVYARRWERLYEFYSDRAAADAQDSIHLLSRVIPEGVALSPSLDLQPNTAFIITNRALVFSGYVIPDLLRVKARAVDAAGAVLTAETTRRIERYKQKNEFIFPVKGRWYLASSSSLRSHHRIRLGHEFALDLIKIGEGGRSFRTDGATPEDYYAFGLEVVAIADGTVIKAEDGIPETGMPRAGESRRDFAVRVLDAMWRQDPSGRIAGGNHVVIEHAAGEHSFYVHLRNGSVNVDAGASVKQGEKIGEVGISGDGFQPHLHFSVSNSASTSYGQGLPVFFNNVRPVPFSSTLDMREQRLYLAGEFVDAFQPEAP